MIKPQVLYRPLETPTSLPRWLQQAWQLLALPLLLFFTIPLLVLVGSTTGERILAGLHENQMLLAIGTSLKTTLFSLIITLLFGTPLAYLVGRFDFRFKQSIDALINLPTVLPPSVAGLALLMTFGRRGFLGETLTDMGIQIAFSQIGVIMAQVFISASFYVRTAALGFASIDDEIIQAAELDGASHWQAFTYVIFPLARSAMITGAAMSWSRALGEFGATLLFAGNFPGRTQTMPLAIYLGFESKIEMALTLSVILLAISFTTLLAVNHLAAKSQPR